MGRIIPKCVPALAIAFLLTCASGVYSQSTYTVNGRVVGEDGQPVNGAVIQIERTDGVKWASSLKTNKRGEYTHAGLPVGGTYKISCVVDGQAVDTRAGVKPRLGEAATINFDMGEVKKLRDAQRLAMETGTMTVEQARQLTPEQRAAVEASLKANEDQIAKNKALNDVFSAGMEASKTGQWEVAAENYAKASEIDPKQDVVWARLAEAYMNVGSKKLGAEQEAVYAKATEAYSKAIELKPAESSYVNNYGTALIKMKKVPEAEAAFEKAATMDPANAYKYYYNLGATLTNSGQIDAAAEAFKKAIAANPKYAIAQYQYAITLVGKAEIGPDGKLVPPAGTREALMAYLELEPSGANAQSAKDLLASFDQTIQTQYTSPEAKKKAEEAAAKKAQQKKR
jgi:tetratricopeptide (TPR) repeat protein